MDKLDEIADLNNLSNLSQDELKKKVLEWIRGNGISEKLHSQLRCDLIASFNKTLLGRYIESQFQSEYRMILSPIILSLNTLVAEFLYAQNCHYSLSVFSTEVPFKNTIPEFEKRDHFKFIKSELNEIFQAVGMESKHLCDIISTSYYANQNKGNNSLLLIMFQNIFNKNISKKLYQPDGIDKLILHEQPVDGVVGDMCSHCRTSNLSRTKNLAINKKNLKYINKYLYISIKKIYKLTKQIDKLEFTVSKDRFHKVDRIVKQKSPSLEQHNNLENLLALNKNLENLTDEFKKLMNVDNINKDSLDYNFVMLINDVIRITNSLNEKFETCNRNVSILLKYFTDGSNNDRLVENVVREKHDSIKATHLKYKEWLESIKESKHGKKFLKKLESNFAKTLIKERQKQAKDLQETLEKEKSVIRLHYRQKYLEHLTKKTEQNHESQTQINALHGLIKQNTKFIEHSDRVLQELDKKSTIQENINTETVQNEKLSEKQPIVLSQHPLYNISIEPIKFDEITQTLIPIVQFDDHVEDLVLDAKKRICELDKESEQLDQYFQNYLQCQVSEKSKYKIDMSKIWNKYNAGRVVLNNKNYKLINQACEVDLQKASDLNEELLYLLGSKDENSYLNINKMKDQVENPKQQINFPIKNTQQENTRQPNNEPKLLIDKRIDYSITYGNSIKNVIPFKNISIENKCQEKEGINQRTGAVDNTRDINHVNQI